MYLLCKRLDVQQFSSSSQVREHKVCFKLPRPTLSRHFSVSSFPFPISYFLVPSFRATRLKHNRCGARDGKTRNVIDGQGFRTGCRSFCPSSCRDHRSLLKLGKGMNRLIVRQHSLKFHKYYAFCDKSIKFAIHVTKGVTKRFGY